METFCVGGITWVLGGTEECKREDYRKVTTSKLIMEGNHENITEPHGEISWIFIVTQPRSSNPLPPPPQTPQAAGDEIIIFS